MTPRPPQPKPRIDRAREATHSRSPEMPSPPCKVGLAKLVTGLNFGHIGTVALMHPYGDKNKHRTNLPLRKDRNVLSERRLAGSDSPRALQICKAEASRRRHELFCFTRWE